MTYEEFLKSKMMIAPDGGLDIDPKEVNDALNPHQKDAVLWACKGGNRALFESFGLGKSSQQLEWCRLMAGHSDGWALIVLPLGVKQEFTRDAVQLLGWKEPPPYVRTMEEAKMAMKRETENKVLLTNYERVRDGDIDPEQFVCTSLDEASVLRSFGSKTYQTFLEKFRNVKYKLVATATPSPNRYKELIHYAGYLGIMDTGQALTRFFQRNSQKANDLTIYPHKVEEFWLWISTWALFIQKPSDLGYDDTGYELPPMDVRYHRLTRSEDEYDTEKDGQVRLYHDAAIGLTQAAREKRDSIGVRVRKAKEIIDSDPDAHFIIWHDLEAERHAIKKAIPEAVEVYGTLDYDEREKRVIDFSEGETRILATKKEINGSGCNFQRHCHRAIFLGIDYEFNDWFQAVHRIYRFLQTETVIIDVIYMDTEDEILHVLKEKWKRHEEMAERMAQILRQYGMHTREAAKRMQRSIGVDRMEVTGKHYKAVLNDCIQETATMKDDSVDLIVTSIPFCYDEQTEVLTKDGWCKFSEVKGETEIATYNHEKHGIEYQHPTAIVDEPYTGEMIRFEGRAFDLLVTPNHRMYAARRGTNVKYGIATADEITKSYEESERKSENSKGRILRGWKLQVVPDGLTEGNKPEKIAIPKLPSEIRNGHGVELYWIETEDFMRLAGWYLAEGHADDFDKKTGGRLSIGQSPYVNPENYAEIVALFERIGLPPTQSKNQVTVWCRNLAYFLKTQFGHKAENKHIPRWMFSLDGSLLKIMRDTMMKGDGSRDGTLYASISRQLRDDFQELCMLTGWRAIIPHEDQKWIYTGEKEIYPEIRHNPQRVQYEGKIGCVTVQNGLIIVRRNGFTCISGNSNHYEYTASYNDLGHNEDTNKFFQQMDYLAPNLLRVLKPGRIFACHVKDRVLFGSQTGTGMPSIEPFHDLTTLHYMKHGFQYIGMITVVTDVVRENNQTYRLGWSEQCKDGSKMGVGCPEYVLLFRKLPSSNEKAYADVPVEKSKEEYTRAQWQIDAHAFWRSSGNRLMSKEELEKIPVKDLQRVYREFSRGTVYSYEDHVELAKKLDAKGSLPATFMVVAPGSWQDDVWDDIVRMRTLNSEQAKGNRQLHVCPLQQDLVDRLINRYSNLGETVYDPFGGLMTVPVEAVKLGREGIGCELNAGYFRDGVGYLEQADAGRDNPSLFDFIGEEAQ